MKKILSLISILLILTLSLSQYLVFASANETNEYGDFSYKIETRGGITGLEIIDYIGRDSHVIIPESIDGEPVVSIGPSCFLNKSFIVDFTFPESLVHVSDYAFDGTGWFENFESDFVIINDILIRYKAKDNNTKSLEVPENIKKIGYGAFEFCTFEGIVLPPGLEEIYPLAFYQCTALSSILIPASVISIDTSDTSSFKYCHALEYIEVQEGNEKYSSYGGALLNKNQTNLIFCPRGMVGSYILPETVKYISSEAFAECSNLSSVILPEGLLEIENWAFSSCFSLTSIEIPDSVTKIDYSAFINCRNLASVKLSSAITEIDETAFLSCEALKKITISDNIEEIGQYAFGYVLDDKLGTIYKVDGFEIIVDNRGDVKYSESAVVEYANKNKIKFSFLNDDFERDLGDIDGDGKITAADARIALRASAKLVTLSYYRQLASDVNNDGKVSASDARKILRVAAKIENFDQ